MSVFFLVSCLLVVCLSSAAAGNEPYLLLPPPLSTTPQAWHVRGSLEGLPFDSYFSVSPQFDDGGALVAQYSWQNMSFLGLPAVAFEGVAYQTANHSYLQAALTGGACSVFNEIVNCTGWQYDAATALWLNNCTLYRDCGPGVGTTGSFTTQILTAAGEPAQLLKMTSTTSTDVNGVTNTAVVSWSFLAPRTPVAYCSAQPSCLCSPATLCSSS